jgi:hypothetical protein
VGCLLVVIALAVPRVVLFIAFLATTWFAQAFETRLWPLLGFIFMPYGTLAYIAAMLNNGHALTGRWLALLIVALVVDVLHWGGGGHRYTRRTRPARE